MVAQLAMADVPENKMEKTRKVYGILKQQFYGSWESIVDLHHFDLVV